MSLKLPSLNVPRDKPCTFVLAQDEHAFLQSLADDLGISVASIIRNAAFASLMVTDNPLHTAREQHVTTVPRVHQWRVKQMNKDGDAPREQVW